MEAKELKKNHWYRINQYGFSNGIKGKLIYTFGDYAILKFYWGLPFRTKNKVELFEIIEECEKPSLFSNY